MCSGFKERSDRGENNMAVRKSPKKRFFTPSQANSMLPLVRRIVEDITQLAGTLRERHQTLNRLKPREGRELSPSQRQEVELNEAELVKGGERMEELVQELIDLGVLLKDFDIGLVDFPHLMDGREVYLCWKLGEPEVAHWHEVNSGYAGRQ